MYFNEYLLCIDINFEIQIPRNTNKGDRKAISVGSIVNFFPFLYIRVLESEDGATGILTIISVQKCQFRALSGN